MQLLAINDMAKILNVPVSWIYGKTRTNEIPHLKVGKYVRFNPDKVLEWIEQQSDRE